jgi:hypothetical protein
LFPAAPVDHGKPKRQWCGAHCVMADEPSLPAPPPVPHLPEALLLHVLLEVAQLPLSTVAALNWTLRLAVLLGRGGGAAPLPRRTRWVGAGCGESLAAFETALATLLLRWRQDRGRGCILDHHHNSPHHRNVQAAFRPDMERAGRTVSIGSGWTDAIAVLQVAALFAQVIA